MLAIVKQAYLQIIESLEEQMALLEKQAAEAKQRSEASRQSEERESPTEFKAIAVEKEKEVILFTLCSPN